MICEKAVLESHGRNNTVICIAMKMPVLLQTNVINILPIPLHNPFLYTFNNHHNNQRRQQAKIDPTLHPNHPHLAPHQATTTHHHTLRNTSMNMMHRCTSSLASPQAIYSTNHLKSPTGQTPPLPPSPPTPPPPPPCFTSDPTRHSYGTMVFHF